MADDNQEQQEQNEQNEQQEQSSSGPGAGTAVKAVAAAAATGAAALAAKKVMSGRGGGSNGGSSNGGSPEREGQGGDEGEGSILNSVLSGGWEAARDALLPAAEDAAGAAGEYVAQHGPDVLRERIVPRFVDSFNEARDSS
jgi:hypothetical protein